MRLFTDGHLRSFEMMMQDTGEHPYRNDDRCKEPYKRANLSGKNLKQECMNKDGENYGSHQS